MKRTGKIAILFIISVTMLIQSVFTFFGCAKSERWEIVSRENATCETDGFTISIDAVSGERKVTKIPAKGHDFVLAGHYVPECGQEGYDLFRCSRCLKEEKRNVTEAKPHAYVFKAHVRSTCTANGYDEYECAYCKKQKRVNYTDFADHDFVFNRTLSLGAIENKCTECDETEIVCSSVLDENGSFLNADFESENNDGWILSGGSSIVSDGITANGKCVRIENATDSEQTAESFAFAVKFGKTVRLSYDYMTTGSATFTAITLNFFDEDFAPCCEPVMLGQKRTAGVWQTAESEAITVPFGARFVSITLGASGTDGFVRYDDFSLKYTSLPVVSDLSDDGSFYNGGFEISADGYIPNWSVYKLSEKDVSRVTTVVDAGGSGVSGAFEGDYSLKINSLAPMLGGVESGLVRVKGGVAYEISAKSVNYYSSGVTRLKIEVFGDEEMTKPLFSETTSTAAFRTREWNVYSIDFTVPENGRYARVSLLSASGVSYWDDVLLYEYTAERMAVRLGRLVSAGKVTEAAEYLLSDGFKGDGVDEKYTYRYCQAIADEWNFESDLTPEALRAFIAKVNASPDDYRLCIEVFNSGFEDNDGNSAVGWTSIGNDKNSSASIAHDVVYDGESSLKITKTAGDARRLVSRGMAVEPGCGYILTAKAYCTSYADASAYLYASYYTDAELTDYITSEIGRASISDEWGTVSLAFTVPENARYITVSIAETYEISVVTMYFDNVEVKPFTENTFLTLLGERLNDFDRYQVRYLLKSTELEKFGAIDGNLEKYIYTLKKELETKSLTLADVKRIISDVNENADAVSEKIANEAAESVGAQSVEECGAVGLPETLADFAEKYYVKGYFSLETESDYLKVENGNLFVVKRPSAAVGDVTEKAIVHAYLHGKSASKEISVTIKAYESAEQEAVGSLSFEEIRGLNESEDRIVSSLSLPAEKGGVALTWSSSSESVISSAGAVTRPEYGENGKVVSLVAKAGDYEKQFNFVVLAKDADEENFVDVANGNLENYDEETIGNWFRYSDFGTLERTKEKVFQGDYSLKLSSAAGHDLTQAFCNGIFDVTEGRRYRARATVYTDGENSWPGIYLQFYSIQGILIDYGYAEYDMTNPGSWQELCVEYTAPIGAASAKISLYTSRGEAYFDCVRYSSLPLVDNGDFSYGSAAWNGGTVENGEMKISAGQKVSPVPSGFGYSVSPDQRYELCFDSKGSSLVVNALYFDDSGNEKGKSTFVTESSSVYKNNSFVFRTESGGNFLSFGFISQNGAAYIDNVSFTIKPYGTQIVDGGFENAGSANSEWKITNGAVTQNDAIVGSKSLELFDGGSALSNKIPVQAGKKYVVSAKVFAEHSVKTGIIVRFYNVWGDFLSDKDLSKQVERGESTLNAEIVAAGTCSYMTVELFSESATLLFDEVNVYALSTSLSNAQFENVFDAVGCSGGIPYQWSVGGNLTVVSVGGTNFPDGVRGVSLSGKGTFSSSFVSAEENVIYEGEIYARAVSGSVRFKLDFYDENFALVGSSEPEALSGSEWTENAVSGLAPAKTKYAVMVFVSDGGAAVIDRGTLYEKVRTIGNNRQMFLDDYMIESTEGLELEVHQAKQSEYFKYNNDELPYEDLGGAFYGTVMYDEEESLYKMWYMAASTDVIGYAQNYSTSVDGVHWTNPILCRYEYNGSYDNNILDGRWSYHGLSVYKDKSATDPNKRYIMVYCDIDRPYDETGYVFAYSADGITINSQFMFLQYRDVVRMTKDVDNGLFVVVAKCVITRRDQFMMVVKNLEDLSETVPILMNSAASPLDGLDCFCPDSNDVGVYPMYDGYVGLSNVIKVEDPNGMMVGITNVKLLYSRDLSEEWTRPTYESIIRDGDKGEYSYGFKGITNTMFETDDEIWLYASGSLAGQWRPEYQGSIIDAQSKAMFICKWRKDGFVSLNAATVGKLTTKAFVFDGNALTLNFEGKGVKVEVLDEDGNVIPGYSESDCDKLGGDFVSKNVTFGGSDLSDLNGKVVRLRITLENAKLYSFGVEKN